MTSLSRGQKIRLSELSNSLQLQVSLHFEAPNLSFDFSCFGLDENGQLSDDRYFIFYNQTESPESALKLVKFAAREAKFALDLARLPKTVNRLVFVATVDGTGAMSGINSGQISFDDAQGTKAQFAFKGSDFGTEKAVMVAEVYLKGEWRVSANGQGFAEGLSAVLRHFGGQEIEDDAPQNNELRAKAVPTVAAPPPTPAAAPPAVEMVKPSVPSAVELAPTGKVNLQKSQTVSLSKMAPAGLKRIKLGLGWDPADRGRRIDLDGSCIAFDAQKKVIETVWFGHLGSRDGTIQHSGDNLTGHGEGDDEVIRIDLERLAPNITTLVFTINSFMGQKFSSIKNAFCRVVNEDTRQEMARYDLGQAGNVTGMIMAKITRENGEWKMTAIGEPAGGITVHFLVKAVKKII